MRDFAKQRSIFLSETGQESSDAASLESGSSGTEINLFQEMEVMSQLSALIYTVAYLLDLVGKGGYPVTSSWFPWSQPELKQLEEIDLVVADRGDATHYASLKPNLPADKVLTFINANADALSKDDEITGDTDGDEVHPRTKLILNALRDIKQGAKDNFLWSFDHHFEGTEIVYAITVNRSIGRVTVAFRGSVTGKDWWQNSQVTLASVKTPTSLKKLGFTEEMKVHGGFMRYLLDDDIVTKDYSSDEMDRERPGKYGKILRDLAACYNYEENGKKVHKEFQLYVTGHSLGGALSTLLAMKLATSTYLSEKVEHLPKPIVNISVASPYVGNQAFHNACKVLEKDDLLRHVRITNEGDVVPVAPPKYFLYGSIYEPYVHTGLNVHLMEGKDAHQIGFDMERTFASQFGFSSGDRHAVVDYYDRQNEDKEALEKLSTTGLYEQNSRSKTS